MDSSAAPEGGLVATAAPEFQLDERTEKGFVAWYKTLSKVSGQPVACALQRGGSSSKARY
jgi:hypothetical protein